MSRGRQHPRETAIGQNLRLGIYCKQPPKSDAEVPLADFGQDFFRSCQLVVAGHVFCCRYQILHGKCRYSHGVKAFRLRLHSHFEPDQRTRTHRSIAPHSANSSLVESRIGVLSNGSRRRPALRNTAEANLGWVAIFQRSPAGASSHQLMTTNSKKVVKRGKCFVLRDWRRGRD